MLYIIYINVSSYEIFCCLLQLLSPLWGNTDATLLCEGVKETPLTSKNEKQAGDYEREER